MKMDYLSGGAGPTKGASPGTIVTERRGDDVGVLNAMKELEAQVQEVEVNGDGSPSGLDEFDEDDEEIKQKMLPKH